MVGCRIRGKVHVAEFGRIPGVEIAYVCDPDPALAEAQAKIVEEKTGKRPTVVQDLRKIYDDKTVNTVSIEDVSPPREVSSAFDEVQRAEQDEDKMLEQANQYANKIRGEANGQAAQIREEAAGYKNQIVQEALGESQRFLSVYEQYKKAPDITRKRLYLETMEKVLTNSKKVITDSSASTNGVLPLLPLNDLAKPADTKGAQK